MSLETLLSLDGEIFPMDNGYWTKFEIQQIEPSEQAPHGIKYSLTLHDRENHRVFGVDNAHAFKPKRKKFGAKRTAWDHQHLREKVTPYEFESPEGLLEYFWKEVDKIVKRKRI